ncbi:MAG: anion permease, partial [Bacteroidales bacterium]|nr:anion permease [Bacteroidales bacterium]
DVILVVAGRDFDNRTSGIQDFYFLSVSKDSIKVENYKVYIILTGLITAIVLSSLGIMDLFVGLLVLMVIVLLLQVTKAKQLSAQIDYNLALIIVMSLALGTAMEKTHAADIIANGIVRMFLPFGEVGTLFGIYLITTMLAAFITNKASVGIIFPIAISTAETLGVPYTPFLLTVAYASAANFMTPIGYQTNLMVYGPGDYKFKDFFKVGVPLTLLYMVVTVLILSYRYF